MADQESSAQKRCDKGAKQEVCVANANVQAIRAFADHKSQHQDTTEPNQNTRRICDQVSDVSQACNSGEHLGCDPCAVEKFRQENGLRPMALEEIGGIGKRLWPPPAEERQAANLVCRNKPAGKIPAEIRKDRRCGGNGDDGQQIQFSEQGEVTAGNKMVSPPRSRATKRARYEWSVNMCCMRADVSSANYLKLAGLEINRGLNTHSNG